MTDLRAPLILVSTGRAGSTALHRLLAHHRELSWLSGLSDRFPRRPALQRRLLAAIDRPLVGPRLQRRFRPGEAYGFWRSLYGGFPRPFRDLTGADLTPETRDRIRAAFAALATGHRQRPLIKVTGWPRLGFLAELFPDARFVHLVRDGRAVARSLHEVEFWHGWQGPAGWRWGPLPDPLAAAWEETGRSFLGLAALQWALLVDAFDTARDTAAPTGSVLELRYEDLCADPRSALDTLLDHAGLAPDPRLDQALDAAPFRNTNHKWRDGLSADQRRLLDDLLADRLAARGYEP